MQPTDDSSLPVHGPEGDETTSSLPPLVIPPLIVEAQEAFRRDLPQLLQEWPGYWVAYRGSQRIGIAKSDLDLYAECRRRGIDDEEFVVRSIEPEMGEIWFGPLY